MKRTDHRDLEFGKRLKKLREDKALSPSSFAKSLGVAVSTYRDWEQGRAITGQPYTRMAQILDVSVSNLFGGEPMQTSTALLKVDQIRTLLEELRRHFKS